MKTYKAMIFFLLVFGTTSMTMAQEIKDIISPHFHFNGAIGESTGHPEDLALGHHDPTREDGTVQGIELGFSLRYEDFLQGFATYNFSYGANEEWEDELEEAFLKFIIPGLPFELRGGRVLSRIGLLNNKHLHSWNFVDMPLVMGRFLGDDGLIKDGGDLTFSMGDEYQAIVTIGYGEAKTHDHDHEHSCGDEGVMNDQVLTSKASLRIKPNDFHQYSFGFTALQGDNGYSQDTNIYGFDFSYTWRQNGLQPGGKALQWNTEFFQRDVEYSHHDHEHEEEEGHHEEEEHEEEHDGSNSDEKETGLYSELIFTHNAHLDLGLRYDYVEGADEIEAHERSRFSTNITYYIDEMRNYMLRFQYNCDDLKEHDEKEHTYWLQVGISYGGGEVR